MVVDLCPNVERVYTIESFRMWGNQLLLQEKQPVDAALGCIILRFYNLTRKKVRRRAGG